MQNMPLLSHGLFFLFAFLQMAQTIVSFTVFEWKKKHRAIRKKLYSRQATISRSSMSLTSYDSEQAPPDTNKVHPAPPADANKDGMEADPGKVFIGPNSKKSRTGNVGQDGEAKPDKISDVVSVLSSHNSKRQADITAKPHTRSHSVTLVHLGPPKKHSVGARGKHRRHTFQDQSQIDPTDNGASAKVAPVLTGTVQTTDDVQSAAHTDNGEYTAQMGSGGIDDGIDPNHSRSKTVQETENKAKNETIETVETRDVMQSEKPAKTGWSTISAANGKLGTQTEASSSNGDDNAIKRSFSWSKVIKQLGPKTPLSLRTVFSIKHKKVKKETIHQAEPKETAQTTDVVQSKAPKIGWSHATVQPGGNNRDGLHPMGPRSATVKGLKLKKMLTNFAQSRTEHKAKKEIIREAELQSFKEDMRKQRILMLVLCYAGVAFFTTFSMCTCMLTFLHARRINFFSCLLP